MSASTVVALVVMLTATTLPAAAQQPAEPDSARAELRSELRAFYFSLAHRDWEALSARILPAKVVAQQPVPEDIVAASARAEGPSTCPSATSAAVAGAVITLRDNWAEVSVTRCGAEVAGTDEFRFIHFEGRWWIVFIDLFREQAVVEVAR